MTAILVALAAAIAVVAGIVALGVRRQRRLLADAHWLEVARALPALKRAALERIDADSPKAGDPRVLQTTAGLLVAYVVMRDGDGFVHQCSLNVPSGAVAASLLAMITAGLGIRREHTVFLTRRVGCHALLKFDAAEHERVAAQPCPEITEAELPRLREDRVIFLPAELTRGG